MEHWKPAEGRATVIWALEYCRIDIGEINVFFPRVLHDYIIQQQACDLFKKGSYFDWKSYT